MPIRFAASLLVVIGLALTGIGRAAPPAQKAPRTDLLGDPLPEGVVARLGTERLVLYGASYFAFSGNGRFLAVANMGPDLRLWEVASGREVWRAKVPPFRGYSPGVNPLAFSADGKRLALGCADECIRVWDAASGRETQRLPCQGGVWQLAFSPDGKVLASGGAAKGIHVWDPAAGRLLDTWGGMKTPRLAFSRDGKTLTATVPDEKGGVESQVSTWDAAKGEERGRQPLEPTPGWAGALSPEGSLFAAPTADGKAIRLIATASGKEVGRTEGEASWPAVVAFAGDGRTLTATSHDGTVRVWRADDGKLAHRITGLPPVDRVALSPDGKVLVTVHQTDQRVHLWDVAKGKERHAFIGHPSGPLAVAFSRDGEAVFTASHSASRSTPPSRVGEWSLRRWDPQTGKETRAAVRATKGEVYHAAFSPDGSRLAVVEHDGTLRLWDTAADKELRAWKVPTRESRLGGGGQVITFALADVSEPRFTADGKVLFVTHGNRVLRWDTATGKELPSLKSDGNETMTGSCQPSPDGRLVVLTTFQDTQWKTTLFDVPKGRPLFDLSPKGWPHNAVAFSPDGRTVALDEGALVLLWEVASGRPRGRLAGGGYYTSLAFSPDGRFLAVGGDDKVPLRLWDLTSDRPADAPWHSGRTLSLAFSPDGRRLALAGFSNTALVCDVRALFKEAPAERLKLSADECSALWADLTGAEGDRAYRAVQRLAASGPDGVTFLKDRLKAPAETDAKRVARLLKDLDDDEFDKREKATEELKGLGERAETALREALKNGPSAEARTRIERLLERLKPGENPPPSPELVGLRVIEALELNAGPEARAALEGLAKGTDNERLVAEAKASLTRLAGR